MKNQSASSLHFQRKISEFCNVGIAPVATKRALENIRPYLISLIIHRKTPPMRNGRIDWQAVADACGIEDEMTAELKKTVRSGLEAIVRWLDKERPAEDDRPVVERPKRKARTAAGSAKTMMARRSSSAATGTIEREETRAKPGVQPRPIEEFPKPLFDWTEEPEGFQQAPPARRKLLASASRRYPRRRCLRSQDAAELDERHQGAAVDRKLRDPLPYRAAVPAARWLFQSQAAASGAIGVGPRGRKRYRCCGAAPARLASAGQLQQPAVCQAGGNPGMVRRVIISGSTDYRRFQALATRQRYAIRFPAVSYGGSPSPRASSDALEWEVDDCTPIEDPDLLSGVVDAPPRLAMEMANLIRFKTATLTALGFQRNGVWGEETAAQKIEHLGLMFGALAASPKGPVKGYGVPLSQLSFGLLVFPGVWDWYLQWRERRRGFYTTWEEDMLSVLLNLVRTETGWLWQHPELVRNVKPIPGLISEAEIAAAERDWYAACDTCFKHASHRSKEIQRVMRVHRDPFEPIMCVLEADSPLAEYRKITDEILKRMPDEDRYPRAAAEAVRSFLMLRLGLHLGLRQKNLRQLLVCPRGHFPTSERRLEDMKRGEIRWSDRDRGWEVLVPANDFKNANSSFFGSKPFRLASKPHRRSSGYGRRPCCWPSPSSRKECRDRRRRPTAPRDAARCRRLGICREVQKVRQDYLA